MQPILSQEPDSVSSYQGKRWPVDLGRDTDPQSRPPLVLSPSKAVFYQTAALGRQQLWILWRTLPSGQDPPEKVPLFAMSVPVTGFSTKRTICVAVPEFLPVSFRVSHGLSWLVEGAASAIADPKSLNKETLMGYSILVLTTSQQLTIRRGTEDEGNVATAAGLNAVTWLPTVYNKQVAKLWSQRKTTKIPIWSKLVRFKEFLCISGHQIFFLFNTKSTFLHAGTVTAV